MQSQSPDETPVQPNPTTPLLTAREAADFLGISERLLWTLTKEDRIKSTRINRRVLYTQEALRRFIDENTFGGEPA